MNLKKLFQIAIDRRASDLHLVADLKPFLRIYGDLVEIEEENILSAKDIEQMITSILSPKEKEKFLEKKDLDFSYSVDKNHRFRVNIHFEKGNMGLVARVINYKIPTLEELGMPEIVYKLLKLKKGFILITGPTGCGKSTTLASMIEYINNNRKANIITLEDPIEFLFKSKKSIIIQRQLGADMNSFAQGLKHALRQDPNVIMVGEMRDLETIATAITLAETGHLVLATLHTYSAAQTIARIIDSFPPYQQSQIRSQMGAILAGIISQRLLPKKGEGRIAAREVLINNPAVANLIRENKPEQINSVIETNSKLGMISMTRDIKRLYKEGQISKETAQMYLTNSGII